MDKELKAAAEAFLPNDPTLPTMPNLRIFLSTDGKCTVEVSGPATYADDMYDMATKLYGKIDKNDTIFKTSTNVYKSQPQQQWLGGRTETETQKCDKCGSPMELKQGTSKKPGVNFGKPYKFWGCTTYPKCDGTKFVAK